MEAKPKVELIKPVNLECLDLQEYLKTKPIAVIESLYSYPSICLAVYRLVFQTGKKWLICIYLLTWNFFRELPELARQFVIRILFVEQPVPQAVITSWTSQLHSKFVFVQFFFKKKSHLS